MKFFMKKRPPLTEHQKKFSYSKYYYLPMAPIPEYKLAILAAGPIDPGKALKIENRTELQEPGYQECESGYCVMEDGSGYVANYTLMPQATIEMAEWWFVWHSLEDVRYKIWDPEDHIYARNLHREKALDRTLPMRERIYGCSHDILEDIGGGPVKIMLDFKRPREFGFDETKIGSEAGSTIVCGVGRHGDFATIMTHLFREVAGGIELRSRFWVAYNIVDGKPVKLVPDGVRIPVDEVKGMFAHNIKEFSNLSVLLPKVYAEEKDNW